MNIPGIQAAITAVHDLDGQRIRRARVERIKAQCGLEKEEEAHAKAGRVHVLRLRRAMTNALKPHRIDWDDFSTGISLDGRDHSAMIWLRGTLVAATTGPRFASSLRVTLPFDMHPKSAEQFAAQLRTLKAGADAIQAAGY